MTPAAAAAQFRAMFEVDLRWVLPSLRLPTLVLHRSQFLVGPEHGSYLAEHIPDARFVELPGSDSMISGEAADLVLDVIQEFLTGERPAHVEDRVLATVLFNDIVQSTETTARLGDRRWRALLDEHDRVVGRELNRFAGTLVKTTGDGVLATFDGPARAVRCARAIRDAVAALDLEVRSGLHTGEIELRGSDVAGIAVVIAQRISALAGAGQVLVSNTVKELVFGSELSFAEHGEHQLKGVPGTWRVFAVDG
jgi:class 3 adenylate cyclase